MEIIERYSNELSEEEKDDMFKMYVLSYSLGGQSLWFKTKDELFNRYSCFVSYDNNYLVCYAMFQFKKRFNKISLVCHNGSEEGKSNSINLRYNLITRSGWILEAADKVSWILRKKNAPIIQDYESILDALDIIGNPNDTIQLNPDFDYNDRFSYQYIRTYVDVVNNKTYHSKETLFGTIPCDYSNSYECSRKCNISGGKNKIKKSKKHRKRSRKTKKRRRRN